MERLRYNWTTQKCEFYSQLFAADSINSDYFNHVFVLVKSCLHDKAIPVELVSTYRQSSFITHRKDESAIFFDVAQSFLLKALFKQISSGSGFISITNILKQSACLYIVQENYNYASLVSQCPIIPSNDYYLVGNTELESYGKMMSGLSKPLQSSYFSQLIDSFIIGHELFHFMKFRGLIDDEWMKFSNVYFDFAFKQCCYEDQPDFEYIASYNGRIPTSPEASEKIRKDLEIRRDYYTKNAANLKEEIACDMFAFEILTHAFLPKEDIPVPLLKEYTYLFYMIFVFFDLHFAMNKRVVLSSKSSIYHTKPADAADINLRKVALVQIMCNYVSSKIFPNDTDDSSFKVFYKNFHESMFEFKIAVDSLYGMPATRAIQAILSNCEKVRGFIPPKQVYDFHIKSFTERLIDKDEIFNTHDHPNAFKYS